MGRAEKNSRAPRQAFLASCWRGKKTVNCAIPPIFKSLGRSQRTGPAAPPAIPAALRAAAAEKSGAGGGRRAGDAACRARRPREIQRRLVAQDLVDRDPQT